MFIGLIPQHLQITPSNRVLLEVNTGSHLGEKKRQQTKNNSSLLKLYFGTYLSYSIQITQK